MTPEEKFDRLWKPCKHRGLDGYMLSANEDLHLFMHGHGHYRGISCDILIGPNKKKIKTIYSPISEDFVKASPAIINAAHAELDELAALYAGCANALIRASIETKEDNMNG